MFCEVRPIYINAAQIWANTVQENCIKIQLSKTLTAHVSFGNVRAVATHRDGGFKLFWTLTIVSLPTRAQNRIPQPLHPEVSRVYGLYGAFENLAVILFFIFYGTTYIFSDERFQCSIKEIHFKPN